MMDSAEIKRLILMNSDKSPAVSGIKKYLEQHRGEAGKNSDDIIEMGKAFEALVNMPGWVYLEEYMINSANPINILFEENNESRKGVARGLIQTLQFVDRVIKEKNRIMEERNAQRKEGTGNAAGNTD